jgi:Domain of unknown function (DUF1905)
MEFEFKEKLWRWKGVAPAAWHFITLPEDVGAQIKFMTGKRKGFGSVRVKAVIGGTGWKTSLFPDTKSGSYLLPVKAAVRKSESVAAGDVVAVTLMIDV